MDSFNQFFVGSEERGWYSQMRWTTMQHSPTFAQSDQYKAYRTNLLQSVFDQFHLILSICSNYFRLISKTEIKEISKRSDELRALQSNTRRHSWLLHSSKQVAFYLSTVLINIKILTSVYSSIIQPASLVVQSQSEMNWMSRNLIAQLNSILLGQISGFGSIQFNSKK